MTKIISLHHYDKWDGFDEKPYSFMPLKEEYIIRQKAGKITLTAEGQRVAEQILGRPINVKNTAFIIDDFESNLDLFRAKIREAERMITILYNSRS